MVANKIKKIQKRDGRIVDFDQQKITDAILKAVTASNQGDGEESKKLSDKVAELLNRRFKENGIPQVEQIQDIVEEVLISENFAETAKAYILYREQRRRIREATGGIDESLEMIDKYIKELDWQVYENANMAYSLQGLNHYGVSALTKSYWLNKVYPKEIREAAEGGDFHIHNLDTLATYCNGWDLYDLLLKGFGGVAGKVESKPAKHLASALGQLVNFWYIVQGESAGAQAISSFDTLLAPFIRYDNLNYHQVKQHIQEFLFNCSISTRVGFQNPFTNLTIDIKPSPALAKQPVVIGGKPQKETYGEFQEEINMLNRAFYEGLMEGDAKGRPFTFPIPTVNITKDFDWDDPNLDPLWEATAKYGVNYFSNFINSDMKPEDTRSMCCLTKNTPMLFKNDEQIHYSEIKNLATRGEVITEASSKQVIWKKAKNLKILSVDGKGQSSFVPVKNILIRKYQGPILEFILEDGTGFEVTPDHPCFIVKNGRILEAKAEDLSQNDYILITKGYSKALKDSKKKISFKQKTLDLNYEFGRFIGLFLAEGAGSPKYYRVIWCFGDKEKELIAFIKSFLTDILKLKCSMNHHCRDKTVYISAHDKDLFNLLRRDFGTDELAKNKNLGEMVFDSPKEFRLGMIKGFLEGDGYRRIKRDGSIEISFHIASHKLAMGLRNLLKSLDINSSIRKQTAKNPRNPKEILDSWSVSIVTEDFDKLKINGIASSARSRWYTLPPKEIGFHREDIKTYNQKNRPATRETFDKGKKIHPRILARDIKSYPALFDLFTNSDLYCKNIIKIRKKRYNDFVYDVEVGVPYAAFQLPNGVVTHNCRLKLDNRELYKRGGGLFGSQPLTGSIGVVTINMPRLGYLSKTKKEFFERLGHMMDLAKESLEIKRKSLDNFMEKGLYPYSRYYLSGIKQMRGNYYGNHFSTIGLVGMNETLLNFIGENIGSKQGKKLAIEIMDFMRERLIKYQEETNNLYNLEATPAESTAYRLAQKDKEKYPDIITAGEQEPYYTNSIHLPVNYTDDLFEVLKLQDELQTKFTGGTVIHLFLGERIFDIQMVKSLVKKIFENFRLPYITLTPTFSICPSHGYLTGEHFECPQCTIKQPCEVYSRIVGYLRPVQQWNKGKKEEFRQRQEYQAPKSERALVSTPK